MVSRILFVDDEPNVLQAFERLLRKSFEFETAPGPEPGMRAIRQNGPFAVVVSDLRIPGMDGTQFLAAVRKLAPDTIRIMLTGQADLQATIEAVNQGNIFRFLLKPCPRAALAGALEAALRQYQLVMAERELLEKTLSGAIHVLTDVLSLVNPVAFSRAYRLRTYVSHMASCLQLEQRWQFKVAAMLSQIGCITVPAEVLNMAVTTDPLSAEEREILEEHPQVARQLIEIVPRLELVAAMISGQSGGESIQDLPPNPADASAVSIGSELLRAANAFDELTRGGLPGLSAVAQMRRSRRRSEKLLAALETVAVERECLIPRMVALEEVDTRMIINQDVYTKNGTLLLAKGHKVTLTALARLKSFSRTVGIVEPFCVLAPSSPAAATILSQS